MAEFLHGIRIEEINEGPQLVNAVGASVIGLIGTAPQGPSGAPVLINSRKQGVEVFGEMQPKFTIPRALNAIFDQTGASVVVINIASAQVSKVTATSAETGDDGRKRSKGNNESNTTPSQPQLEEFSTKSIDQAVEALLSAESIVHQTPRILIAPQVSEDQMHLQKLLTAAQRLRAVVIADGPRRKEGETYESYIDSTLLGYPTSISSDYKDRLYLIAPSVIAEDNESVSASPYVAGVIAKSDSERGFWYTPSNRPILGIKGLDVPVSFALGDPKSAANKLNMAGIATIIHQNGYRLWGNRTCASGLWRFLSVRRTADIINDSLLKAHLWAVDRNITKTYVSEVIEGVNQFLRNLKRDQAILGGKCWADDQANTPADIEDGRVTFSFEFTPPYPAEQITFKSRIVNNYLKELFA